jgi:putative ABC transport system ATP-binding protein
MVTHDAQAAAHADRVVFLADGNAVQEMREPTAEAILDEIKSLEI